MKTIFLKELKRTRMGLIIWSSIVSLIALMGIIEYPVLGPNMHLVEEALAAIPKIGQLVFGVYNVNLNEITGYYIVMYYWTGLIVFTHAIYTGASIISKESRDKTAEYLFTKPYKRDTIVWAKIFAGFVNILVIGVITVIMYLLGMLIITDDPVVYMQILVSGLGMLLTQCVLMALGLLCSAIFRTYKSGARGAILVLLTSYCLMFSLQFADMPSLHFLSSLTYFSVSHVVANGLDIPYILLAVSVIAVCIYFTQRVYAKKVMVQ